MKPVLLPASLAANAVLLAGFIWLTVNFRGSERALAGNGAAQPQPALSSPGTPTTSPLSARTTAAADPWQSPVAIQEWLVANRAPLELRYLIAQAMLIQKYGMLFDAVRNPPEGKRWQRRHPKPDQFEREAALRRQQDEEYAQLFGADLAKARYGEDTVARSGLTAKSWLEINRVNRDYMDATLKLTRSRSLTTNERRLLEDEKNADLAKLLSPAEYEIYQAYYSADAGRIQRAMGGLDVDDETYLRAFRAMVAAKSPPPRTGSPVPMRSDEIQAIGKAVGPEIADHLAKGLDRRPSPRPQPASPPPAASSKP